MICCSDGREFRSIPPANAQNYKSAFVRCVGTCGVQGEGNSTDDELDESNSVAEIGAEVGEGLESFRDESSVQPASLEGQLSLSQLR